MIVCEKIYDPLKGHYCRLFIQIVYFVKCSELFYYNKYSGSSSFRGKNTEKYGVHTSLIELCSD